MALDPDGFYPWVEATCRPYRKRPWMDGPAAPIALFFRTPEGRSFSVLKDLAYQDPINNPAESLRFMPLRVREELARDMRVGPPLHGSVMGWRWAEDPLPEGAGRAGRRPRGASCP